MAGFASRAAIASASLQLLFKKLCDRVDARNVGDFGGRLVLVLNRVKDFLPKNLTWSPRISIMVRVMSSPILIFSSVFLERISIKPLPARLWP